MVLPDLARRIGERFDALKLSLGERYSARTVREGPWLPLAMLEEEDDAAGLCGPPLTADRLAAMVANFDLRAYVPPIITGKDGGSHWQGEYLDPLGHIAQVDFDGLTLWGKAAEICDYGDSRVEGAVSTGRFKRSIRFLYGSEPSSTYLAHLALSGGEIEGQPGLIPLTHAFPAALMRESDAAEEAAEGEMPQASADRFKGSLQIGERTFPPAQPAPSPETDMDDTKLQEMFTGLRTGITGDIQTAVTAAVDPLKAELATVKEQLATATATADRMATDARRSGFRTALDGLVREARLAPAEVDIQLEALMALPQETADKLLGGLRTRQPLLGRYATTPLTVGEGANAVEAASLLLGDPIIDPAELSPRAAERFAEIVSAAGGPEAAKSHENLLRGALAAGALPWDGGRLSPAN